MIRREINIKEIILTNGEITFVDDEDYDYLNQYKWREVFNGYVGGSVNGKRVLIHRLIMNTPKDLVVDHIDGNKKNNTKSNLRNCTRKENSKNRKSQGGTSQYKGVFWFDKLDAWEAYMYHNNERLYFGLFTNEIACANAYNYYAKQYHGEFANLNDIPYMSKEEWEKYIRNNKTSKYKGVCFFEGKWLAQVWNGKRNIVAGTFDNELDAVKAYNELAIKIRGNKAKINIL